MGLDEIDAKAESRIWELFENQCSYSNIAKQLLEEQNINIAKWRVRTVIQRLKKQKPIQRNFKETTQPENKPSVKKIKNAKNDVQKATRPKSLTSCIICTESFKKFRSSSDRAADLNFTTNIQSFCELFSLPPNYFNEELKVPIVFLLQKLCETCKKKIQCISNIFKEIKELNRKVTELKNEVEKNLTRVTSNDFRDKFRIRKHLQQKFNISPQTSGKSTAMPPEAEYIFETRNNDTISVTVISSLEPSGPDFIQFEGVDNIDADDAAVNYDSAPASPIHVNCNDVDGPIFDEEVHASVLEDIKEEEEKGEAHLELERLSEKAASEFCTVNADPENYEDQEINLSEMSLQQPTLYSSSPESNVLTNQTSIQKNIVDARVKECSVVVTRLNIANHENSEKVVYKHLSCEHCSEHFKSKPTLSIHKRKVHAKLYPFFCKICNMGFKYKAKLEIHQLRRACRGAQYTCATCSTTFKSSKDLVQHRKIHPFKRAPKKCEACQVSFSRFNHLRRHERKYHGAPYPFVCEICKQGYNTQRKLEKHQLYHIGVYDFKCSICPAKYPFQEALDKHILNVHEKAAVFQCPLCPSKIKYKDKLTIHMRIHSGERPYMCDICGMAFYTQIKLKYHSSIHTKERPFLCQECGYSCRLNGMLQSHLKLHEMHRKLKESVAEAADTNIDGEILRKLPVPRLAKPRNRRLGFPRTYRSRIVTADSQQTEPEINVTAATEPEPETVPEPQSAVDK